MNKHLVLGRLRGLRKNARALEQECDELIGHIETEPQNDLDDMVDQSQSELSARRHCAAVRRRKSQGQPGAFKIGRRYLLSREAYAEELGRASRPGLEKALASPSVARASARDRMLDKLRVVRK